jgi:F-type H+-transporting ATPase subunit b
MKTFHRIIGTLVVAFCPAVVMAAEEGGIVPQDYGLQIWTLVTFLILLGLLAKFAFKPIAQALDRRGETIKKSIDEAEKQRAEAKQLMDDYRKQLAEARTEANKILEEARGLGENVRKEVVEKANAEASALLQRSQEELQRQKEKGVQELKDTVASLSVQIASKVIEKELNEAGHRQLVENLIKDLAKIQKKA